MHTHIHTHTTWLSKKFAKFRRVPKTKEDSSAGDISGSAEGQINHGAKIVHLCYNLNDTYFNVL